MGGGMILVICIVEDKISEIFNYNLVYSFHGCLERGEKGL